MEERSTTYALAACDLEAGITDITDEVVLDTDEAVVASEPRSLALMADVDEEPPPTERTPSLRRDTRPVPVVTIPPEAYRDPS